MRKKKYILYTVSSATCGFATHRFNYLQAGGQTLPWTICECSQLRPLLPSESSCWIPECSSTKWEKEDKWHIGIGNSRPPLNCSLQLPETRICFGKCKGRDSMEPNWCWWCCLPACLLEIHLEWQDISKGLQAEAGQPSQVACQKWNPLSQWTGLWIPSKDLFRVPPKQDREVGCYPAALPWCLPNTSLWHLSKFRQLVASFLCNTMQKTRTHCSNNC